MPNGCWKGVWRTGRQHISCGFVHTATTTDSSTRQSAANAGGNERLIESGKLQDQQGRHLTHNGDWTVTARHEQQERIVSGGIWRFANDIAFGYCGLAMLYFLGGLLLVGIINTCEWLFGPDLGWRIGFWAVIVGAVVLASFGYKAWWRREMQRRVVELMRGQDHLEQTTHR